MNDAAEAVDWRELREFAAVNLTESFALSWHLESETLMIDVDVQLTPEHPFFETPRRREKVCIRAAVIEFPYCESLIVEGRESLSPADAAAAMGHGAITGLRRLADGRYEIAGDFGLVLVDAERPLLRLKGH